MKKSFFRRLLRLIVRTDEEQERIYEDFCRFIERVPKKGNLLDVGCADGDATARYAEALNIVKDEIHGIEFSDKYIEAAEKGLRLSKLDLEKDVFPFSDETFEVITCNQILEHLKNIFLPLSEMERVLKTGGYLAIGIPNLAALHNRFFIVSGLQPLCNAILGPHIRCFTHKAFVDFLKLNSNFDLVAVGGSSLYPLPYPMVKFGARMFPGLSAYTFYLLRKIKHEPQKSAWKINSIGDTYL